jgi:8-oxo-dGTP pyrophosphatase MutT (NUDIX family)
MPEAAAPRPSASVILVRDAPAGLETFMVRRHAQSRVAPSAFVFPGGTVRPDDGLPVDFAPSLSTRSDTPVPAEEARAFYVAAVRELFEEAGVLLACDKPGQLLGVDDSDVDLQERLATARLALQARELSLAQLLRERRWQPAFDELVPFSHWVTPDLLAARFDTRFFIAHMPPRQSALHCTIETSEGIWLRPADLLDGAYAVVYATAQHLRRLVPYESVSELLVFARQKPIKRVQPEVHDTGNGLTVWLPPHLAETW